VNRTTAAIALLILLSPGALLRAAQQEVVGQAVTITLTNGSKITGTVTRREGGKVTLKADLIGEIVIDEKDIAGFGPAATPAPAPTVPAEATTSKVTWTNTATLGYTYISGTAPLLGVGVTNGVNLAGYTERTTQKDAVALIGNYVYQRTEPAGTAANNGSLTLAYNRPLNQRYTLLSRSTYLTNTIERINYRFTNLDGVGFLPVETKKVKLTIAPGVGFTTISRNESNPILAALFANVKNDALGYGVFDSLVVTFMPTLTLNQTFAHLHSVQDSGQYVSQFQCSLVGLVSPRVGLSITFSSNYDSQLPEPYISKVTNTLTSGIQLKF
jgi:hypothetical protein